MERRQSGRFPAQGAGAFRPLNAGLAAPSHRSGEPGSPAMHRPWRVPRRPLRRWGGNRTVRGASFPRLLVDVSHPSGVQTPSAPEIGSQGCRARYLAAPETGWPGKMSCFARFLAKARHNLPLAFTMQQGPVPTQHRCGTSKLGGTRLTRMKESHEVYEIRQGTSDERPLCWRRP